MIKGLRALCGNSLRLLNKKMLFQDLPIFMVAIVVLVFNTQKAWPEIKNKIGSSLLKNQQIHKPSPELAIEADVIAKNSHGLSTYLSIRTTKIGPPENRDEIAMLREKYPENDILNMVETAELVGIKQLPLEVAGTLTRMDKYLELYPELRAYYVGIDYKLKEGIKSSYAYDGVNYYLYILGLEDGKWVIAQASVAPVSLISKEGYGFGTVEEEKAIKFQKERPLR